MSALRIAIACLVAVVWAVLYIASAFNPDVNPPPELSGVMLAVVTWLFGAAYRDGLKKQKERVRRVLDAMKDTEADADDPPSR